jgi:hypothetical protein
MLYNNRNDKKGAYAISQISILIIALFAFAFILNEASFVSATEKDCSPSGSIGPAAGCKEGEKCNKDYKCEPIKKEEEKNGGTKVVGGVTKGVAAVGLASNALDAPTKIKGIAAKVSGRAAPKTELATKASAELTTKFGTRLFGRHVSWTGASKSRVLAVTAGKDTAYLFGQGAIKSSGTLFGGAMTVLAYAGIAAAAFAVGKLIGMAITKDVRQANSIGAAAGAGVFTALVITGSASAGSTATILGASVGFGPIGVAAGVVIAAAVYLFAGKKTSYEIVKYQCLPYVAVSGRDRCEECNDGRFPCTEYQCASLGRTCELVNQDTGRELCVARSRSVVPPTISPWEKALPDGYVYNPLTTNFPEDRGVKVINENTANGCVGPFEDISFGITLDTPSICKISDRRVASWEEMGPEYFPSSQGLSAYNHSVKVFYPDKASLDAAGFESTEGFNEFFVRCEDPDGNRNLANFVFRFCVDESPDLSEPSIKYTSPINGAPIKFNQSSIESSFFLDKPSECKWDYVDKVYEDMEYEMLCASSIGDATPYQFSMVYPCRTTLDSLVNYVENDFYVRCKSYPEKNETERVVMEKSDKFTLVGTRPLVIDETGPTETEKSPAQVIQVELYARTMGGASEGDSICYFSQTDEEGKYISFFNTNDYEHTQDLWLGPGVYTYHIKCADAGGNIAKSNTTFIVESDTQEPLIARAYNEDGYMKLVTNEEARCSYSVFGCEYSFEDGVQFDGSDQFNHYTLWDTESTLYVKCEDIFNNRPLSENECSIIVRPYDEFVSKVE